MFDSSVLVRDVLIQLGVPTDEITPEAALFNDLNVDSTEMIELISVIEHKIETSIDEKLLKNVKTVAELVTFVDSYTNKIAH